VVGFVMDDTVRFEKENANSDIGPRAYILVIDDDPVVLSTLGRALTHAGFKIILTRFGAKGLDYLEVIPVDLVILDISLPDMDGLELCRRLRAMPQPEYSSLPILILSARNETKDVVAGLNAGADDYLVKPFELVELYARVKTLLRRTSILSQSTARQLEVAGLQLDTTTFQAWTEDGTIQLTSTESRLLEHMMRSAGKPQSVDSLLQAVWEYPPDVGDPDLVRTHIKNLRRKLESDPGNPRYVRTIHGLGYIVDE
jgi:DNA-binding response OmpR family regulator